MGLFDKKMNYQQTIDFILKNKDTLFNIWKALQTNQFSRWALNKLNKKGPKFYETEEGKAHFYLLTSKNYDDVVKMKVDKMIYLTNESLDVMFHENIYTQKSNFKEIDSVLEDLTALENFYLENSRIDKAREFSKMKEQFTIAAENLYNMIDWDKIAQDHSMASNIKKLLPKYYLENHAKDILFKNNGTELRFNELGTKFLVKDLKELNPEAYEEVVDTLNENDLNKSKTGPIVERTEARTIVTTEKNTGVNHSPKSSGGMTEGM